MKTHFIKRLCQPNSRGSVLVLVGILLVVFLGVAALAIDIGYLSTTRNELQNAADAAALAGAGYLGSVYEGLDATAQATHTFIKSDIRNQVQAVAEKNKAAGSNISIIFDDDDIKIGMWDPVSKTINPETLTGPDAVYVKARRDTKPSPLSTFANSPISTFFARIFNINTMSTAAEAVAALSGPATVGEGELVMPIGLSEREFVSPDACKDLIYFSPTPYSCAGWTTLHDDGISSSSLADRIFDILVSDQCDFCGPTTDSGLTQDGYTWLHNNFTPKNLIENNLDSNVSVPTTTTGDDFSFIGGATSQFGGNYLGSDYDGNTGTPYGPSGALTVATAKDPSPMFAMFDYFRYRDGDSDFTVQEDIYDYSGTTVLYPAGHVFPKNKIWSSTVPVYKDDPNVDCNGTGTNPNTELPILGFAKVIVIQPNPPPDNNLNVIIDCKFSVVKGRGGGGTFGNLKGTVPNLVK